MKNYQLLTTTLAVSGILALGGCPQKNESLTEEDYDDVAVAVGSLVSNPSGGEAGSMIEGLEMTEGPSQPAVEGASGKKTYESAGLKYELLVDCFDADNTIQSECNEVTTHSAGIAVNWTGNLVLPRYSASITRTGEWSLAGLQDSVVTLDGTGSFDIETSFTAIYRPVTKKMDLSYAAEYEEVKLDRDAKAITGGTIRYDVSGSRSVQRGENNRTVEFDVNAEVTFNNDGTASLLLDGSRSYEINLDNGAVVSDDLPADDQQ